MLAQANSEDTKATLTAETDAACELGMFGSPTSTVGRELFRGDDRLDDAISWCRFGRVQRGREVLLLWNSIAGMRVGIGRYSW
jgi:hypothetical protein